MHRDLPVITLNNMTLFPDVVISHSITNLRIVEAIKKTLKSNKEIFVALKKHKTDEIITKDDIYEYGVIAKVLQTYESNKNLEEYKIVLKGLSRARITKFVADELCLKVNAKELKEKENENEEEIDLLKLIICDNFNDLVKISAENDYHFLNDLLEDLKSSDNINTFLSILVNTMSDNQEEKLYYLKNNSIIDKLENMHLSILKILSVKKYKKEIESIFDKNYAEAQKEYFLRQQISILKNELKSISETQYEENEENELFEKLDSLKLDEKIYKKIKREIDKYFKLNQSSSDASHQYLYVQKLLDLPWNREKKENININKCKKILDLEHYGLDDVKERILEYLAVKKISKGKKAPILCLVGPPGVGKTSIVSSVAKAINREFVKISLAGIKDESHIRGHRKTYVASMPGRIMSAIEEANVKNPIILLDEIDKLSLEYATSNVESALLEVLDPSQNKYFVDHYYDIEFDLSNVMFVATANNLSRLSMPLLDRLEIINISGYITNEKIEISKQYLIPKALKNVGLNDTNLIFNDEIIKFIIERYTRELGVRRLESKIEAICRKRAYEIVKDSEKTIDKVLKNSKLELNKDMVIKYLKEPPILKNHILTEDRVGIVNGLAWTQVGGDTLQIEVSLFNGNGKLHLTGQMGDVMKESANIGISYLKSNMKKYNILPDIFSKYDIHIHIPEGAVPKDGPSAGITMVSAVLSAITGRKARHDIAMTGELSLRGDVLAIGGLKEKSLAAYRDKIKKIIIPNDNIKDLEEIPDDIKSDIKFMPVKDVSEVIEQILVKDERKPITLKKYKTLLEEGNIDIEKVYVK